MGNMSYVMFENTSNDLQDCIDELMERDNLHSLSDSEKINAEKMYYLCIEYQRRYEEISEEFNP